MQTPQKESAQSARKSSKQHITEKDKMAQSDNDAYLQPPQEGDKTPSKKSKRSRKPSNARRNGVQSDAGEFNDGSDRNQPVQKGGKHKMTPAKAIRSDAYAGPTFHQSPAASAIPLPSFMPRSLPNPAVVNPITETDGSSEISRAEAPVTMNRQSTPLDWMFNAARKNQGTPTGHTAARVVSQNGSPVPSPAIRKDETDFPFELDTEDENKSVYTTPLAQRFSAAKTHSTSEGGLTLTDEERKAKTAALKSALMNPGGMLGTPFNENPFQARNAPPTDPREPRHSSNPSTPAYQNGYANNNQYFNYSQVSPSRNYAQQNSRPASSNLRNVYNPTFGSAPMSPPATAPAQSNTVTRSPPPSRQLNYATNFSAIYGHQRPSSEGNATSRAQKPGVDQGLDDLRKALKLTNLGQGN